MYVKNLSETAKNEQIKKSVFIVVLHITATIRSSLIDFSQTLMEWQDIMHFIHMLLDVSL